MMKTIIRFTSALFLLFSLQSNITLADDPIPEVTVVGYTGGGYSGSTDMGPMNAPGQGLNSQYSILTSYGKAKMEEERIKKCLANADATGEKCNNAYTTIQPICAALTGYFGGALLTKFYGKILGGAIDSSAAQAIQSGMAVTGANKDEYAINCTYLTNQAVQYCAAGVKKMKEECK